jgi:hypothetical protein
MKRVKVAAFLLLSAFSTPNLYAGNDLGKIFVPIFTVGATLATGGALGPALLAGGVTAVAVATNQSAPPVVANVTDHGLERVSVAQQRAEDNKIVDAVLNPTFVDRPLATALPTPEATVAAMIAPTLAPPEGASTAIVPQTEQTSRELAAQLVMRKFLRPEVRNPLPTMILAHNYILPPAPGPDYESQRAQQLKNIGFPVDDFGVPLADSIIESHMRPSLVRAATLLPELFEAEVVKRRASGELSFRFTTPSLSWMNDIREAPPPPKPPEDRTFMSMIRAANKRPPLKTIQMRVPIAKLSLSNIAAVAANLPSYNFGTFSSEVIAEAASMFIPGGAGKLAKAGLALARAGIKLISLADTAGSVEDFLKEYHFVSESGDRTPREEIRAESSGTFQMAGGILEKIREVKTFNDILRTAHRKEMEATIDWYSVSPRERAIAHQRRLAEEKAEREKREEEEALAKFRLTPLERAIAHHKKLDEEKLARQEKAKTEAAEAKKYISSGGGSSIQPPEGDGGDKKQDKKDLLQVKIRLNEEDSKRFGVQRAIQEKPRAAREGRARLNDPQRDGSITKMFRKNAERQLERQGADPKILKKVDVDHTHELQLGGSDTPGNLQFLDRSVNRSIGAQISRQTKGLPKGTKIDEIVFEIVEKK